MLINTKTLIGTLRAHAETLRKGGAPASAEIYEEVALSLDEALADAECQCPVMALCKEHIAQYKRQGMAGKAEAVQVLAGELERL